MFRKFFSRPASYLSQKRVEFSGMPIKTEWEKCIPSKRSRVNHPIRYYLEKDIIFPKEHSKKHISLALGEPITQTGFPLPQNVKKAMINIIEDGESNGYTFSTGTPAAKEAVVKRFSTEEYPFTANEVIISPGSYISLYLCQMTLCHPGDNMLVPNPGFPLVPQAQNLDFNLKTYELIPEKNWEVDLEQLESLIDEKTKILLVNNPSNPCGSVWTKKHMLDIIEIAKKHKIMILSDEAYYDLVFDPKSKFYSFGNLSKEVPVIVTSSVSKLFCVPGWRLGWMIVYNNKNYFDEFLKSVTTTTQLFLSAPTLVQAALPEMLLNTPPEFHENYKRKVKACADYFYAEFSKCPGLKPIQPQGAIYMMLELVCDEFKDITDDKDFCQKLITEQNVFLLPGQTVGVKNFIRSLICATEEQQVEIVKRVKEFCQTHAK